MPIHNTPHPLAGKTVKTNTGAEVTIEDWQDRVIGRPWMDAKGNPVCIKYMIRCLSGRVPLDNEVVYVKFNGVGVILHVSEIQEDENAGTEDSK